MGVNMDMRILERRLENLEQQLLVAQKERTKAEEQQKKQEREMRALESCRLEDQRHTAQLDKMVISLQAKMENYREQAEEAEQLAATNLNLYRRKQQELEEAEERAKLNEEEMRKIIRK